MNKILLSAALAALCILPAAAEGYQVNTLSAKQNGMGHTGTALKLGAESQIFNPAGMGWMNKKIDFSASVSPIFSYVTCTHEGKDYKTDNKASTPMSINAAFTITDNIKAGISFYTPYGSGIDWTKNWPGAVLSQKVSLKVFTVQPTVAWRITHNLSIGAGLMLTWGNVDLTKGLVDTKSFDQLLQLQAAAANLQALAAGQQPTAVAPEYKSCPASVNLQGNAHPRFGVNLGIMWDITEQWTLGLNFRSESQMSVKSGSAQVTYADPIAEQVLDNSLGYINDNGVTFKASMPACAIWNLGVAYKPIANLTIAADLQFTHWKAYDYLDFQFTGIREEPGMPSNRFDQHITKNYHNTFTYHLGAQYNVTERFDARVGLMVDTSPCDSNNFNPETPGQTRILPSVGLSFRPIPQLSIDFAFIYVHGMGHKNCVGHYDNFLADAFNDGLAKYNAGLNTPVAPNVTFGQYLAANGMTMPSFEPMAKDGTFVADYKLHAFIPSIGITLSF